MVCVCMCVPTHTHRHPPTLRGRVPGGSPAPSQVPATSPAFFFQGLCKLGSAGGTDFSMKQFAEGSTLKLAKQCRK